MAAHQVQKKNRIKEIHYATGGALGGTRVDQEFVKLFNELFGKEFIESFKNEHPSQWVQVMLEFEKKKRVTSSKKKSLNIQLPWDFAVKYKELHGKSLPEAIKDSDKAGIKFANGLLCIDYDELKLLFSPVIRDIMAHIEDLLKKPQLQDVKYFFCVGGFNDSKILQEAYQEHFGSRIQLIFPEEASLTIVKGAVQFGHNPNIISTRISSKTYGVDTWSNFIPFLHPSEKARKVGNYIYCDDIFKKFVQKGQEVPVNYTKTIDFSPIDADQDLVEVNIFHSEDPSVEFVTDPRVHHAGRIIVQWPGYGLDRMLKITMMFGGTEITVSAVTFPGENRADTRIDFLAEQV